jgi:hypothetical protein
VLRLRAGIVLDDGDPARLAEAVLQIKASPPNQYQRTAIARHVTQEFNRSDLAVKYYGEIRKVAGLAGENGNRGQTYAGQGG